MPIQRKLNLARYKKGIQGIIDFASLLEQADPQTRERILESTQSQDPQFLAQVLRKVVYFEELIYLDESILAEIMGKASPKLIAYALIGMPVEFQERLFHHLGFREKKQVSDEREKMGEKTPEGLTQGAQRQILKIARDLESQNKFTFEVISSPRLKGKLKRRA